MKNTSHSPNTMQAATHATISPIEQGEQGEQGRPFAEPASGLQKPQFRPMHSQRALPLHDQSSAFIPKSIAIRAVNTPANHTKA